MSEFKKYLHILGWEAFFSDSAGREDSLFSNSPLSEEASGLQELIRLGAYPEAIDLCLDSLSRNPRDRDVKVALVEAWSLLNWLPASEHLKSLGPQDMRANLLLARQALELRDGPAALGFTELLVSARPDSLHARTLHAVAQALASSEPDALSRATGILEISGDQNAAYLAAVFRWAEGNSDEALSQIALCATNDPNNVNHLGQYLNCLLRCGRNAELVDAFDRCRTSAKNGWVVRRLAAIARSHLNARDMNVHELMTMHQNAPLDRIVPLRLLRILSDRHSYLRAFRVWFTYALAETRSSSEIKRALASK